MASEKMTVARAMVKALGQNRRAGSPAASLFRRYRIVYQEYYLLFQGIVGEKEYPFLLYGFVPGAGHEVRYGQSVQDRIEFAE